MTTDMTLFRNPHRLMFELVDAAVARGDVLGRVDPAYIVSLNVMAEVQDRPWFIEPDGSVTETKTVASALAAHTYYSRFE